MVMGAQDVLRSQANDSDQDDIIELPDSVTAQARGGGVGAQIPEPIPGIEKIEPGDELECLYHPATGTIMYRKREDA